MTKPLKLLLFRVAVASYVAVASNVSVASDVSAVKRE